jgi:FkbM family methyltransferase
MNEPDATDPRSTETAVSPRRVNLNTYLAAPSRALHEFSRLFRADAAITIFDIGCCEGEDSIRFSRHFPNATVFAIEALPDNQRICRENFAYYDTPRVELVPLALCNRIGTTDFYVSSGAPQDRIPGWNYGNKSSSVLPPKDPGAAMLGWLEFKREITVPCTTLDEFCRGRGLTAINLVHMDVQGAESLVLAGASRILPRIGAIWLEVSVNELYAGQQLKDRIATVLHAAGFRLLREFMRPDGEGDQLWLNRRHPRSWLRQLTAALGQAKYRLLHRAR